MKEQVNRYCAGLKESRHKELKKTYWMKPKKVKFNAVKKTDQQGFGPTNIKRGRKVPQNNCRYCGTLHDPCRWPSMLMMWQI